MIKKFKLIIYFTLILFSQFLLTNSLSSEINGINDYKLNTNTIGQNYNFIIAGHLYGAPSPSIYPSASFLSNLNKINELKSDFLILLGDFIQHPNQIEIDVFNNLISEELRIPIFNTPGNHDLGYPELYEKNFGKTFDSFVINQEAYILLDTELSQCNIDGYQASFFSDKLRTYSQDDKLLNIFILMHQPLWSINNQPLDTINPWVNGGPYSSEVCSSFSKQFIPKIKDLAKNKNIYLISGDFGCKNYELGKYPMETFPIFYHKDLNLTYVGTGMCENIHDNVVNITVNEGIVDLHLISLNKKEMGLIESYNLNYWREEFKNDSPKKKKSLQKNSLLERIFKNKYFYLGLILGIGMMISLFFIRFIYRLNRKIE